MTLEDWDNDRHQGDPAAAEARRHQGRDARVVRTHRYMKMDTSVQRINAAVGLMITLLIGTKWAA
jgi:hypothetical protein